jgi:hypothetical protein
MTVASGEIGAKTVVLRTTRMFEGEGANLLGAASSVLKTGSIKAMLINTNTAIDIGRMLTPPGETKLGPEPFPLRFRA